MMYALEDLLSLPRHTHGSITLNRISIAYNDPLALYNEYKDIFIHKIYHFNSPHPAPVILDVGGYIGLSALYFKTLFPGAKITVFEPEPAIFALLKANLVNNGFSDVLLIAAAAGKEKTKALFYPDGADGGSLLAREQTRVIEVNLVRLSDYIAGDIDLLKMNIEGMEGDVFEEIEPKLSRVKEIIFEYHAFAHLPQRLGDILTRLDRNGFKYLVTDVPCARTPLPVGMNQNYKHFNLIYARKM